jgi:hypothetical protein
MLLISATHVGSVPFFAATATRLLQRTREVLTGNIEITRGELTT